MQVGDSRGAFRALCGTLPMEMIRENNDRVRSRIH